jgi:hypothetical protein
MFAFQLRKEIAIRIILMVVTLFNAFVSAPVLAQEPEPTASLTLRVTSHGKITAHNAMVMAHKVSSQKSISMVYEG